MENKTFKEIYREKSSLSPRRQFIIDIARKTMRAEMTVRMWLAGRQIPDALTQAIIAEELGVENVRSLFPVDEEGVNE